MRPLLAIAGVLVFAAPFASAQAANSLAGELAEGVACTESDAEATIRENIAQTEAPPSEIVAALNVIVADVSACAPLRDAAKALASSVDLRRAPAEEDRTAAASAKVVDDTLAEAERRVATMKFEVGPPPPRLTRGRTPGL